MCVQAGILLVIEQGSSGVLDQAVEVVTGVDNLQGQKPQDPSRLKYRRKAKDKHLSEQYKNAAKTEKKG